MRYLTFIVIALLSLVSCKDKQTIEEPNIDFGYEYFPLEIGSELIYRVDSTIYDPQENSVEILTSMTYIREVVVDTFQDELGRLSHKVERFERPNVAVDWELKNVWSAVRTETQAERFEDNLRFIKMVFPVDDGDIWNGVAYLDVTVEYPVAGDRVAIFKSWDNNTEVIDQGQPETVGDFAFEEVTTIQLADEENLLEKRYGIEKYAKGVGLIFKELQIYNTQDIENETEPWEVKTERGFRVVMTLVDYK
ncbi:MAG: hypothetical protein ACI8YQ_004250 [Polaribacter sp.]|jgi:hypothetical protein